MTVFKNRGSKDSTLEVHTYMLDGGDPIFGTIGTEIASPTLSLDPRLVPRHASQM